MSADKAETDRREFLSGAIKVGCAAAVTPTYGCSSLVANGAELMQNDHNPRLFSFIGGSKGAWRVVSSTAIVGAPLPKISHLDIVQGAVQSSDSTGWILRGVASNERYANREEKTLLLEKQAPLGRPQANLSALIPIRKNAKWWALTQDERRAIFEERSHHVTIGLKYLPAIARRLHHCRDLAEIEPFDFLTLFDYTQESESAFNDMLAELRTTEEWKFIEREVDVRLIKA
jgi:Chlorite dismutase